MEPVIISSQEFHQRYWNYYMLLEKDFLDMEQFVAIDEMNATSFSNEYIKQLQTIGSEIDVISKSFCREIAGHFSGSNINSYCKCITDKNPDFSGRIVVVRNREMQLTPWKGWSYTTSTNANGKTVTTADNPDWWKIYNGVKHKRTTINSDTNLPYYKLANQKNVINSLAALFQLEMYYFRLLWKNHFPNSYDVPDTPSKLFEIQNWGSKWATGVKVCIKKRNV